MHSCARARRSRVKSQAPHACSVTFVPCAGTCDRIGAAFGCCCPYRGQRFSQQTSTWLPKEGLPAVRTVWVVAHPYGAFPAGTQRPRQRAPRNLNIRNPDVVARHECAHARARVHRCTSAHLHTQDAKRAAAGCDILRIARCQNGVAQKLCTPHRGRPLSTPATGKYPRRSATKCPQDESCAATANLTPLRDRSSRATPKAFLASLRPANAQVLRSRATMLRNARALGKTYYRQRGAYTPSKPHRASPRTSKLPPTRLVVTDVSSSPTSGVLHASETVLYFCLPR